MNSIKGFVQSVNDWIDWQEKHKSREEIAGWVMGIPLVITWGICCLMWAMGW